MNPQGLDAFWPYAVSSILFFVIGFYCIIATYNLVRVLIGLELLIKGVTLLMIAVGDICGRQALAQSLIITMIVIEAVVITVAVGIVVGIRMCNNSLDIRRLRQLKG